jgi:hypothetical protein
VEWEGQTLFKADFSHGTSKEIKIEKEETKGR